MSLVESLNILAGTTGLAPDGAANAWAGTTNLGLVDALNHKAGNSNPIPLMGVLNQLAGTDGLGVDDAARAAVEAYSEWIDDPRFQNLDRWTWTSSRLAVASIAGGGATLTAVIDQTAAGGAEISHAGVPIGPGVPIEGSLDLKTGTPAPTGISLRFNLLCYNEAGSSLTGSFAGDTAPPTGELVTRTASGTTPAGTGQVRLALYQIGTGTWAAGTQIMVDNAHLGPQ